MNWGDEKNPIIKYYPTRELMIEHPEFG